MLEVFVTGGMVMAGKARRTARKYGVSWKDLWSFPR